MSEDNGVLAIPEESLKLIMNFMAKKVVGKAMKRFEIHDNTVALKGEMKELLYESFRDTEDLLIASGYGLDPTTFEFKLTKGKAHSTEHK